VIALRQEGFDIIKVMNLCNHCDVNRELCNTTCFFNDGSVFFRKVASNRSNIIQLKDILKPHQRNTILSMQTHVLKSSLLTQRKGWQIDFLLEELSLKTLDVWNSNCNMKNDVIFLGWNNQESISMKKNVEFDDAFQIDNNWTHHHKRIYIMECAKLSKEGDLWC
jgi:hypothetical protein